MPAIRRQVAKILDAALIQRAFEPGSDAETKYTTGWWHFHFGKRRQSPYIRGNKTQLYHLGYDDAKLLLGALNSMEPIAA